MPTKQLVNLQYFEWCLDLDSFNFTCGPDLDPLNIEQCHFTKSRTCNSCLKLIGYNKTMTHLTENIYKKEITIPYCAACNVNKTLPQTFSRLLFMRWHLKKLSFPLICMYNLLLLEISVSAIICKIHEYENFWDNRILELERHVVKTLNQLDPYTLWTPYCIFLFYYYKWNKVRWPKNLQTIWKPNDK